MSERLMRRIDRLAEWWLRRRHPGGRTIMRTKGEQWMLDHYDEIAGPERS